MDNVLVSAVSDHNRFVCWSFFIARNDEVSRVKCDLACAASVLSPNLDSSVFSRLASTTLCLGSEVICCGSVLVSGLLQDLCPQLCLSCRTCACTAV